MYVCVCLAVTEAEVASAIENGARTRAEVTKSCRAGGDCGACHGMIESMLEEHAEVHGVPTITGCPPPVAESGERLVPSEALVRSNRAA